MQRTSTAILTLCLAAAMQPASVWAADAAAKLPAVSVQLLMPVDSTGSDLQETTFGDLMADAVFASANVDGAFVPADEFIPISVPAGKHGVSDFLDVLRNRGDASNHVVVLTLTGEQIVAACNRSVSRVPLPFDGFFQVSHLRLHYKPTEPVAVRVSSVEIGGAAVDLKQTYKIATTRPLANGSFGFFRVWDDKAITQDTGIGIADCLSTYLSNHRVLNTVGSPRISKE